MVHLISRGPLLLLLSVLVVVVFSDPSDATLEPHQLNQLSSIISRLKPGELQEVLRAAGYDHLPTLSNASRSGNANGSNSTESTNAAPMQHHEVHLAEQCKVVVMHTTTPGVPMGDLEGADLVRKSTNYSVEGSDMHFIQMDSSTANGARTGAGAGASHRAGAAPTPDLSKLDCECEEYNCQCRKMCFCQLQEAAFGGNIVPSQNKADATSPSASNIVDNQFKCTCAFETSPGTGALSGGSMDCDCKIADCACEKQCKCKHK